MTMSPEESIKQVRENAELDELADVFEYCYENLEDWENGDIEPEDLPRIGQDEFGRFLGAIIMRSIAFGCSWEEHVPSGER